MSPSGKLVVCLAGLFFLCSSVESHDSLTANELVATPRGVLVLACVLLLLLIGLVLFVLSICCCYAVLTVRKLKLQKGSKEERVQLTKFEETGLDQGDEGMSKTEMSGEGGKTVGVTVTVVELETQQEENTTSTFGHLVDKKESAEPQTSGGESKEEQGTKEDDKKGEGESKEGEPSQPATENQSGPVPPPPPPPPPLNTELLNPSIMKKKPTPEAGGETKPTKEKEKPTVHSGASSIMQELSLAILKPKLTPKPEASPAPENKSSKEETKPTEKSTTSSEAKDDSAGGDQSKSPVETKSETLPSSQKEVKPKTDEKTPQDTKKKEESGASTIMNFADIDSALGQALKDLGDF